MTRKLLAAAPPAPRLGEEAGAIAKRCCVAMVAASLIFQPLTTVSGFSSLVSRFDRLPLTRNQKLETRNASLMGSQALAQPSSLPHLPSTPTEVEITQRTVNASRETGMAPPADPVRDTPLFTAKEFVADTSLWESITKLNGGRPPLVLQAIIGKGARSTTSSDSVLVGVAAIRHALSLAASGEFVYLAASEIPENEAEPSRHYVVIDQAKNLLGSYILQHPDYFGPLDLFQYFFVLLAEAHPKVRFFHLRYLSLGQSDERGQRFRGQRLMSGVFANFGRIVRKHFGGWKASTIATHGAIDRLMAHLTSKTIQSKSEISESGPFTSYEKEIAGVVPVAFPGSSEFSIVQEIQQMPSWHQDKVRLVTVDPLEGASVTPGVSDAVIAEHNRQIVDAFNAVRGKTKVVDFGSLDGEFLANYRESFPDHVIIGFESDPQVREVDDQLAMGLVLGDARETGIKDGSVQKVTILFPDPEKDLESGTARSLLREAWRILEPGGLIDVVVEDPQSVGDVTHAHAPQIVRSDLLSQGFAIQADGARLKDVGPDYPVSSYMEIEHYWNQALLFSAKKAATPARAHSLERAPSPADGAA